jgi:hypothetical protein
MGYDVSYHPISEQEIQEWYFDALGNDEKVNTLVQQHDIKDVYADKYREVLRVGRKTKPSDDFDKTHAYFTAVVQGFFRTYFYIRGGAFSFLLEENPNYKKYTKPWQDILGRKIDGPVHDRITENYCGGAYLTAEGVRNLLEDYAGNASVKAELDRMFAEGTMAVFLKTLNFAKDNHLGLLEATEVIEPNPLDLNQSSCYSNLYNCDKEGPLLYADTAARQIAEAIKNTNTPPKKKSFFSRLFGK